MRGQPKVSPSGQWWISTMGFYSKCYIRLFLTASQSFGYLFRSHRPPKNQVGSLYISYLMYNTRCRPWLVFFNRSNKTITSCFFNWISCKHSYCAYNAVQVSASFWKNNLQTCMKLMIWMNLFNNHLQKIWESKIIQLLSSYCSITVWNKLYFVFKVEIGFSMQASSPTETKLILPHINIVFNWAFIGEQVGK